MTKKTVVISIVSLIVITGFIGVVTYLRFIDVTITFSHVRSASVTYDGIPLASIDHSGTLKFKAPRSANIDIRYVGDATYESSTRTIATTDKATTATLTPYFTKQELQKRAQQQTESINSVITTYNESIPLLYTVTAIKLYHYADWASAKLVWNGDETDSSDTLRVVLQRSGSKWVVVNKPDILLYRDYYKTVPLDILRTVNDN